MAAGKKRAGKCRLLLPGARDEITKGLTLVQIPCNHCACERCGLKGYPGSYHKLIRFMIGGDGKIGLSPGLRRITFDEP